MKLVLETVSDGLKRHIELSALPDSNQGPYRTFDLSLRVVVFVANYILVSEEGVWLVPVYSIVSLAFA